jgi:hypothetical protein
VLMVKGWPWVRARLRRLSAARMRALAALCVCIAVAAAPAAIVRRLTGLRGGGQADAQIPRDDARALDWIARSKLPGGVLTTEALGAWVPAVTDRPTWVGHPTWSPAELRHAGATFGLFNGAVDRDPAGERAFVLATGATFVLQPCGTPAHLQAGLLPAGFRVVGLGCATVYWRATQPRPKGSR